MPRPTESLYAVICEDDCKGKVLMTEEEYDRQMRNPDAFWYCPVCGGCAMFDDGHYENRLEKDNDKSKR